MAGRASRLKPTVADIIDMLTMHPEERRKLVSAARGNRRLLVVPILTLSPA